MCGIISVRVGAKVNLSLDVKQKRSDGYHGISSIFHSLALSDMLTIKKATKKSLATNNPLVPSDDNNLVLKALRQLELYTDTVLNCAFTLQKEIPLAAGLGGGSADAAGALLLANKLFELNLSPEELRLIALKVGADVPFMLTGGAALVEGIGEKITPLMAAPKWGILLIKPPFGIKTAEAYKLLDRSQLEHFDEKDLINALKVKDYRKLGLSLGNSFTLPLIKECPSLNLIISTLKEIGLKQVSLSGSGPTIFALTEDQNTARVLTEKLSKKLPNWYYPENHGQSDLILKGKDIKPWLYFTQLSKEGWQLNKE